MHISDVVWASGITAVALLIQAALTNWREAVRLKRDSIERDKDRSRAVEDHWRDERLAAHADFLAAVDEVGLEAGRVVRTLQAGRPAEGPVQVTEALNTTLSRVQMLASSAALPKAIAVWRACRDIAHKTRGVEDVDPADREREAEEITDAVKVLSRRLGDYRDAARRDIGTDT